MCLAIPRYWQTRISSHKLTCDSIPDGPDNGYARALQLQIDRRVDCKQFISHKITDLSKGNEAFTYCDEAGKDKDVGACKVMFDIGGFE